MSYVQKFATGGAQPDGSLAFSAYNKIFFFALFLFSNHDKKETKEPLASKNKPSYCETKWQKFTKLLYMKVTPILECDIDG